MVLRRSSKRDKLILLLNTGDLGGWICPTSPKVFEVMPRFLNETTHSVCALRGQLTDCLRNYTKA